MLPAAEYAQNMRSFLWLVILVRGVESALTLCKSCGSCDYGPKTYDGLSDEYFYKTNIYITCSSCSSVVADGKMYIYQAYSGTNMLSSSMNVYIAFDCSSKRWKNYVVSSCGSSSKFSCMNPHTFGSVETNIVSLGSACPHSNSLGSCISSTTLSPPPSPSPPPPSPQPPPPPPCPSPPPPVANRAPSPPPVATASPSDSAAAGTSTGNSNDQSSARHAVRSTFSTSGQVSDFDDMGVQTAIRQVVADAAAVALSAVTIEIAAGSVLITSTITASDASNAATISAALTDPSTGIFSSTTALRSALSDALPFGTFVSAITNSPTASTSTSSGGAPSGPVIGGAREEATALPRMLLMLLNCRAQAAAAAAAAWAAWVAVSRA